MSKYISIPKIVENYLDKTCIKDEEGNREENEGTQLIRLLKISETKQ